MSLMLMLACASQDARQPGDPGRYTEALEAIRQAPTSAGAVCATVRDPTLHSDCLATAAEALAATQPDEARRLCGQVSDDLLADECWFMIAERSGDRATCDHARRFQDDCRLHLLQQDVAQHTVQSPSDPLLADIIRDAGFAVDDPRALTLVFRHVLAKQPILDVAECDKATSAEWCTRAGAGLFHDRLNNARDTGAITTAWCGGARQAVDSLRYAPHPALDSVIAERTDLCP